VRDIGGMLRYIATREGVEKLGEGWKTAPVSKAQENLILRFVSSLEKSKRLPEYKSYQQAQTKGAASEFISAVLENYPEMLSEKTYLDYIATRPRAERLEGAHGLFTDEGVPINLEEEAERIRNHNGNVFTVIVSLKREDAENLGFNNAERWRDLVRSKISIIAREHGIPLESLKWFGAFHNESHHPHIHLMLYSKSEDAPGYINKKGIDHLRHVFGTSIFRDELKTIHDDQTKVRNKLNADAADEIEELAEKIRTGLVKNGAFVLKFVALAKHLQFVSGKKVYGYLPKSVKKEVCELVDLLEQDEDIARMYELWYQAKCAVYNTYTDNDPIKKPLYQEEAFKPIRNALIREADALGAQLNELDTSTEEEEDTTPTDDGEEAPSKSVPKPNPQPAHSNATAPPTPSASSGGVKHTKSRNGFIATSIARFGNSLSRTFRDNFYDQVEQVPSFVDSRLQREIEAKKKGLRLSM
jgi:hypothetical protein